MIILLDFTQSWNDAWVANGEEDERWLYGLLALTVTAFLGVLGISGGAGEKLLDGLTGIHFVSMEDVSMGSFVLG